MTTTLLHLFNFFSWYMRRFPEWGSYGPGIAPVLAISVSYVVLVLVGHGVMRLVAGPAREDRLAPARGNPPDQAAADHGGS